MGTVIVSIVRYMKQAVAEVIELDTALTELNKVLEVSRKELEQYAEQAYRTGESLGRTGKEVIRATAEFARAGYNLQQSGFLAEQALLLTNVADGLEDTAKAAGYLIAVIKGYNLTVEDTVHVVDLLNETSNSYAVDTVHLTEGLQRTSGTLSQTNTSLEELTGLLTGGFEALRNMEKVSAGLITISTRLRGVSESGEEIDGLMPKLQAAFKEYANIDIQTVNGEMRSTYDILQDLAGVWGQLNDEQRSYLGFLTSGLRQSPVLNAIMLNWNNVENATQTAMQSAGSAIRENEKYMASLQGRLKLLESAFSKLAYHTINSKFVGFLINLATLFLKVADEVGVLTIAFATLFTILQFKGITTISLAFFNTLSLRIAGLITQLGVAQGAALSFAATLSTVFPVLAIAAGVYGLVKAVDYLSVSLEKYTKQVSESDIATQDAINHLKALKEEYINLSQQAELSREQKSRLVDIEHELKRKYGETTQELDLQNKSLAENIELIDEATQKEAERFMLLNERAIKEARKTLSDPYEMGMGWEFENIYEAQIHMEKVLKEAVDESEASYRGKQRVLEKIYKDFDNANEIVDKARYYEELLGITVEETTGKIDDMSDALDGIKDPAEVAGDALKYAGDQADNLTKKFDDAISSFDLLSKAIEELDKYGQLSLRTMSDIAKDHEDLIVPMLLGEVDLRELLTNKMLEMESKAQQEFLNMHIDKINKQLETSNIFFNEMIRGNEGMWNKIAQGYGEDFKNFSTLADMKAKVNDVLVKYIGSSWASIYGTELNALNNLISAMLKSGISISDPRFRQLLAMKAALEESSRQMQFFVDKIDLASVSLGKLGSAAKSAASALKDPYEEWLRTATSIADQVIRIIKDAYNKQKKIALAAIDAERKAAEKAHKERIKQLDEQYKRYEELIKLRQREIDDEADEEDFLRELNKLKEEQGEIESEIAKLALDDSYEARAKREQLEKDLAAKIEEINNLTRNRDKTLRKQALQDQLDNMKKETDEKKSQQEEIYEAEKARLEKIREDTEYHYNELLNNERRFQEIRQAILEGNYERAKEILGEFVDYFGTFNEDMAHTMGVSFQNILNIMDAAKKAIEDLGNLGAPPPSTAGVEEGGGYGGFEGLAASSAAAAESVKSDWEDVARTIGKQFGLTEDALEVFINTFARRMGEGATVVEALESAWADASAHIIDNFVLTDEQASLFKNNLKTYFDEMIDKGHSYETAYNIALSKVIEDLGLTGAEAAMFRDIFVKAMEDGESQGEALKTAFGAVKDDLIENFNLTGISLSEFGSRFEENMKISQTSSEALRRTWSDVAKNIAANTDMTEREIDVFAESFATNMMASNDAAWSLEKAFSDVSDELQKDSGNNKSSVKNMVDEIVRQMGRQVPTLKTRIENTITTIYETIEKVFGKKHEGGIAGIEKAHSGKIVGGASNKDSKAIWDLFSKDLKPYETLIKALDGEVVINPQISMPKFQKNMLGAMGAVANTSTDNSMVNNINFNITANATEADAKKIAKMTLTEIYRGQRRMGKH